YVGVERAIKVYEDALQKEGPLPNSAHYHEELAHLYEEQGNSDSAKKHIKLAIAGYEEEGAVYGAVNLERRYGTLDNVIKILVRAAEVKEAAGGGNYGRLLYHQAAEAAEEAGNLENARQIHEKELDSLLRESCWRLDKEGVITLAKKVGNKDKLIAAYEKFDLPQEAFKVALQEGYTDRAMEICFKMSVTEELSKLAKFTLDKGYQNMTLRIYEHAGLEKEAAKTAIQYGNPQKALEICELKIDTPHENGYYGDADYYDLAMDAASRIGDKERRELIGRKAIHKFSALGEFSVSARFAEKLGDNERARTYTLLASLPKV
ncbi:hypothetical protein J4228_00310, partial [Candidatus Woesearchaeota archaeon]|nr:hypothetical protein [Candidatus Woesearchaeota archaeon]